MASILVIGVGSTGLAVMERAQQFYYEFTKQASPGANSAFMFLETDQNRKAQTTPNGKTDIEACYLNPQNINATLTNWNRAGKWNWMPSAAEVLNSHSGAAGQPAYGRVALWSDESAVRKTISQLYARINGDECTNIYLVGSLTGGTGTGIFLDLAYMVRQCTGNSNIYGMFMLPNSSDVGEVTKDMIYENAYSSLRALDKFSKADTTTEKNFECVLPGGIDISNQASPFYNVQFFTQDFSGATASLTRLSQLVQSVGFNLVLRMLDVTNVKAPFQDLINSRLVDYTSHVTDGIFTTIGLNVFQYPEALLEEYLTTKLLEDTMLKRWADTTNYMDQHLTSYSIKTLEAKLKMDSTRFVQETIEKAVLKTQGGGVLGKPTFKSALESEIETIISGNYQAPSVENYIFSLFDANSQSPNLYSAINGQATNLRDEMIRAIVSKVESEATNYQNLKVVQMLMQYIADSMEAILKDWGIRYKLDGTPNQWNKCWSVNFETRLGSGKWIYASMGAKREWYAEALGGVALLCYFDTFMPMLKSVLDVLLNRNGQNSLATAAGEHLPTMEMWSHISSKVNTLLDPQNNVSLVSRKAEIHGQMFNNDNYQINFLFNGNTCNDDIKVAEGKYQNQTNRLIYSNVSQDSLWRFLYSNDVVEIKGKMIAHGLSFIQRMSLFENTDIVQIMKNLTSKHPLYNKVNNLLTAMPAVIKKNVPAMANLIGTEQFYDHNCLKLIAVSPLADNNASGIVHAMQNFKPSKNSSDYTQLPSLKNTVVVYQEYGYLGMADKRHKAFNPLTHLSYQPQVLEAIKAKLASKSFDQSVRLAYVDAQELINTNNVNIK